MTRTTPPPPRPRSAQQRRRRREQLATWITLSVVVVICAAVGVGAYAMANSWWVVEDPAPSADQELSDGQSRFDRAGTDFFNRQRAVVIDLTTSASASDLGLPADADTPVEALVPLTVTVRADGESLDFSGVTWFALATGGDRLSAVSVQPASSTTWVSIRADLEQRAAQWGWSEADVATLAQQVGDAARAEGQATTASLPPAPLGSITVSAHVAVDADGRLSLQYVFAR